METNNTVLPLWRKLNEQRTIGTFVVDGYFIMATDDPELYPRSYNDGIGIFEAITADNTTDAIPPHFYQVPANLQYAALAVNNLANLADVLEEALDQLETWNTESEPTFTMKRVKEALSRIS